MKQIEKSLKEGQKASLVAALVSLFLAVSKAIIGFLTGSLVLISDALHNAADLMVLFASWFGLKISQRRPDEKFHYGYYKVESLVTLFVSLFLIYTALQLLREGYLRLFTISIILFPILAMSIALLSVIVSLLVSKYLLKVGKKINSQLVIVSSKERFLDAISSAAVFVTVIMSYYQIPYIEGIVTIIISLLIFEIGFFAGKNSIYALMDVSPSKKIEKKIIKTLRKTKNVDDFRNLKLRKSGPFIFGEVTIKVKKFINVTRAHDITEKIERKIKNEFKEVSSFTVHVEPYKREKYKIAIPVMDSKGLESSVMKHFGRANYVFFANVDKKKISGFNIKKNPFKRKKVKAGLALVHFLGKENVNVILTKEIGEISFYTARDYLIDLYKIKGKTVKEAIDNLIEGKLVRLTEPTKKEDIT